MYFAHHQCTTHPHPQRPREWAKFDTFCRKLEVQFCTQNQITVYSFLFELYPGNSCTYITKIEIIENAKYGLFGNMYGYLNYFPHLYELDTRKTHKQKHFVVIFNSLWPSDAI